MLVYGFVRGKSPKVLIIIATLFFVVGVFCLRSQNQVAYSLNLTNVSDTLSTSRLSWVAREGAGNASGSAIVNIDTTQGLYESTSSANLFTNDTLAIANGIALGSFTVKNITSDSQIEISPVLGTNEAAAGSFMIATRSASHTIAFTTSSALPNGAIRVLIPGVSVAANALDGIPDRNGFDFSATPPTVTCPADVGATYDFVAGTASASAVTVGSTLYHAFTCRYSGNGAIGSVFGGLTIASLINPAAKANHVEGTADTYPFIVQNLSSTDAVIDQTVGQIAVVESVRVTATVDPQITFRIGGVASGTSACGLTTDVTTTSAIVPFGSLSISAFTSAAQYLSVSTNATGGYVVTAIQNDQLGRNGNVCTGGGPTFVNPCIPDSTGDGGTMTSTVTAAWTGTTAKGFAYTLADPNSSTTEAFSFASGYRKFADLEQSESPVTLFSGTSVVDNANVYVCYKAVISASQQAGDYTNNITYRATATF